jgi:hypothetical protein
VSVLAAAALALPGSAAAQERIQAGLGLSSGVIGAEAVWVGPRPALALAAGIGVAGVGGRLILEAGAVPAVGAVTRSNYLGLLYLLTPWDFGLIEATGAVGAEAGVRIIDATQRVFADLAFGLAVPHGGSWGGSHLLPALRLQLGGTLR